MMEKFPGKLLFRLKQYSECIRAAVAGNRTACLCDVDLLNFTVSSTVFLTRSIYSCGILEWVMKSRSVLISEYFASSSLTYFTRTLSREPRYFFSTPMLPSWLSTWMQGLSFSMFAPRAVTAEQRPPACIKVSVSRMKLAWHFLVRVLSAPAMDAASMPWAIIFRRQRREALSRWKGCSCLQRGHAPVLLPQGSSSGRNWTGRSRD